VNTDTELLRKLVELAEANEGAHHRMATVKGGTVDADYRADADLLAAAKAAAPALSRLLEAGVPEGWKLVPKVPTREMLVAGNKCMTEVFGEASGEVYRDMIAASPLPTAPNHPPSEGEQT
jgi:hypothetical protein